MRLSDALLLLGYALSLIVATVLALAAVLVALGLVAEALDARITRRKHQAASEIGATR